MFGFIRSLLCSVLRSGTKYARLQSGETIAIEPGEDLLSAALRAGLKWGHDCRQGNCSKCQCVLRQGKVKHRTDFARALTPEQLEQGTILACQTLLKSDIEVEVELNEDDVRVAPEGRDGQITETRLLTHDIMEVVVKVDRPLPAGVLAGQYAEVSYEGLGRPRSYSFASAPAGEDSGYMRFYIRHVPGGTFTSWLFECDRTGQEVKITAPFGDFYLRDNNKTMLCFAGGSGMSAVKALLEGARDARVQRDVVYLFGARQQRDLYCAEGMAHLKKTWTEGNTFEYAEILSDEPDDSDWNGPRGYLIQYLKDRLLKTGKLDIGQCEAYMCGPPPMIDSIIQGLVEEGMDESHIYYDKFEDASTSPELSS